MLPILRELSHRPPTEHGAIIIGRILTSLKLDWGILMVRVFFKGNDVCSLHHLI